MSDEEIDWSLTTWKGNRRQQHRDFVALPFREKLWIIEHLGEVATAFADSRRMRSQLVLPDSHRVRPDAETT